MVRPLGLHVPSEVQECLDRAKALVRPKAEGIFGKEISDLAYPDAAHAIGARRGGVEHEADADALRARFVDRLARFQPKEGLRPDALFSQNAVQALLSLGLPAAEQKRMVHQFAQAHLLPPGQAMAFGNQRHQRLFEQCLAEDVVRLRRFG